MGYFGNPIQLLPVVAAALVVYAFSGTTALSRRRYSWLEHSCSWF
jgi:hypothetical protein